MIFYTSLKKNKSWFTSLLPGEGHQVLPVLVLQGLLLQMLQQGVAVKRPRRALLRLVALPVTSWQHGILGEGGGSNVMLMPH